MDSTTHKFYHIHGMDSLNYLDLYFSAKEDMVFGDDSLIFPMMKLHYLFSSGRIIGKYLIDISIASIVHHLYSATNVFKEVVVLKFNEKCIMELNKWLHDRTGAYDWKHTSAAAAELEGNREKLQEKEMCLKSSIKHILKCNFEQENITAPVVLPLADCVINALILDVISMNKDEYVRNLEKMLKLLKPGGHLIIFGILNATYMLVGGEMYHCLNYDEDFVKDVLLKLGCVINYSAVQRRRNQSDLTDYSDVLFLAARKRE